MRMTSQFPPPDAGKLIPQAKKTPVATTHVECCIFRLPTSPTPSPKDKAGLLGLFSHEADFPIHKSLSQLTTQDLQSPGGLLALKYALSRKRILEFLATQLVPVSPQTKNKQRIREGSQLAAQFDDRESIAIKLIRSDKNESQLPFFIAEITSPAAQATLSIQKVAHEIHVKIAGGLSLVEPLANFVCSSLLPPKMISHYTGEIGIRCIPVSEQDLENRKRALSKSVRPRKLALA